MEASRPLILCKEGEMDWKWVGTLGAIVGILSAYLGYYRGVKSESKTDGEESGVMRTDIKYIKDNIDKLLDEQKLSNEAVKELTKAVIRLDEQKVSNEAFYTLSEKVARLDEKLCMYCNK